MQRALQKRKRLFWIFLVVYTIMCLVWLNKLYMKTGMEDALWHTPVLEFIIHLHSYVQFRKLGLTGIVIVLMGVFSYLPIKKQLNGWIWREIMLLLIAGVCVGITFFTETLMLQLQASFSLRMQYHYMFSSERSI